MLSNALRRELRSILAELYPEVADTRRVLDDAGVTAAQIDFSQKAVNNWHAILTEADKHGQLLDLVAVAREDYPQHAALARVQSALGAPPAATSGSGAAAAHSNPGATTTINTGGGSYIAGNVNTGGGDFVGRNKRG